jgi:hypothetical protein
LRWFVDPGIRCDLVFYAATNLTGKRATLRIFPKGNKQGTDIGPEDLRSMVIRAPIGTRVVLCRGSGPEWEELPWRCVELMRGKVVPPAKATGLPGVRIPDLDLLDSPAAKHVDRDLQATYPKAERLEDGQGWSFGRPGELKGRVTAIRILRPGTADDGPSAQEDLLAQLLERVNQRDPDAARALVDDLVAVLDDADPDRVRERLRDRLER